MISTISGAEQINLIDAARRARVRLFVPSEFEGSLSHRPTNDPLDHGSHAALELLQRCAQAKPHSMQYTIFSCGLFMERFAPGGLQVYNLGSSTGVQSPNDYIADVANATGEIIENNAQGRPVRVNLTSVYDVARFVAAAIEIGPGTWPREFRMRGDHMSVRDIITACSGVRRGNTSFAHFLLRHVSCLGIDNLSQSRSTYPYTHTRPQWQRRSTAGRTETGRDGTISRGSLLLRMDGITSAKQT